MTPESRAAFPILWAGVARCWAAAWRPVCGTRSEKSDGCLEIADDGG